ncbi:MAG: fumarylacetoacetate hydrolase family protein [Pseudomonadota bacterium]
MALDAEQIRAAAQLLASARNENRVHDEIPSDTRPANLADAYAIQDALAEELGWDAGGWFCACTNQVIQDILGLREPYYARLFSRYIFESPARLRSSEYPPIVLECEFGFRLGGDLPSRGDSYTRREVEAAIVSVHPTIEVVAGHLKDWPNQEVWSVIADNGTDGALVVGKGKQDWRELDLVNMPVTLEINGEEKRSGTGANVLGDPLEAFVWLANARSRDGEGLRAHDIQNTGTATEIIWIEPGDEAVAKFEGLGEVALHLQP